MRELGWPDDTCPELWPRIERLYAMSGERFGHHDPVRSIPSGDS